ncbi:Bifunctional transcriptional activator/DNA repair enzyme Ada [compost metagenome]|uniref:Ada metal-binding domain-containing protein n=1 Tax=Brevundimonas diminuta TaxID=293 RepID=UPI000FA1D5B2
MSNLLTSGPLAANYTQRQDRVAAYLARSAAADDRFWCSVVTTGVYCRPSCPSRHARLEHVRFHGSLAEARRTGFRPCRRCHPEDRSLGEERAALVARAQMLIRERLGRISSAELADALGVSRGHFHKVFRCVTGQTPGVFKRQIGVFAPVSLQDSLGTGQA